MGLSRPRGRHVWLIGYYWSRHVVRGGAGLVFLVVALVFGLLVAQMMLAPVEMAKRQAKEEGQELSGDEVLHQIVQIGRPLVQWTLGIEVEKPVDRGPGPMMGMGWSGPRDPWTNYLLDERPALMSLIMLVLLIGMPMLAPMLAFSQLAADVQNRGLRYLLLRTERGNIFLGRFLGTTAFAVAVLAVLMATIALYVGGKFEIYEKGDLAAWSALGFVFLAVLMAPYIALSTALSGMVDSPFLSLTLSNVAIAGGLLGPRLAKLAWAPAEKLKYVLPWGIQTHLLHPEWAHVVGAAAGCLGYAVVFLMVGYWWFDRRDL